MQAATWTEYANGLVHELEASEPDKVAFGNVEQVQELMWDGAAGVGALLEPVRRDAVGYSTLTVGIQPGERGWQATIRAAER